MQLAWIPLATSCPSESPVSGRWLQTHDPALWGDGLRRLVGRCWAGSSGAIFKGQHFPENPRWMETPNASSAVGVQGNKTQNNDILLENVRKKVRVISWEIRGNAWEIHVFSRWTISDHFLTCLLYICVQLVWSCMLMVPIAWNIITPLCSDFEGKYANQLA